MPWRCTTLEHLDDDHAAAAARTRMRERPRFVGHGGLCVVGLSLRRRRREQLAHSRKVVGAGGAGEQAVVADAVEAGGQNVDEEAADELVWCERHVLVAIATFDPVAFHLKVTPLRSS